MKNASGDLYPVVTIVLYFGWEKHWNHPRNLKNVIPIPQELDSYINDYTIHIFEIAWLTDEQVEMFQSDFRIVADFFTQLRKNKGYKPSPQQMTHVDEVLKMLSIFGQNDQFEQLVQFGESKEVTNMNNVIDRIESRCIEKGIAQGISQGIYDLVKTLKELGKENDFIVQKIMENFSLSEEEAKKYL